MWCGAECGVCSSKTTPFPEAARRPQGAWLRLPRAPRVQDRDLLWEGRGVFRRFPRISGGGASPPPEYQVAGPGPAADSEGLAVEMLLHHRRPHRTGAVSESGSSWPGRERVAGLGPVDVDCGTALEAVRHCGGRVGVYVLGPACTAAVQGPGPLHRGAAVAACPPRRSRAAPQSHLEGLVYPARVKCRLELLLRHVQRRPHLQGPPAPAPLPEAGRPPVVLRRPASRGGTTAGAAGPA